MIRIAIAEDISRIADSLKKKIELSPEFKVQFISPNGKELIKNLQHNHNVDVVMMDINMPEMNGILTTETINQRWPQIKVIMCTVFDDEQNLFDAIMAGACGYLMKDETPQKIHRSLYEAMEGGAPMSQPIARKSLRLIQSGITHLNKKEVDYKLTAREQEIIEHLAKGLSYEQIADNLYITYGTVRKHVENVYKKLQVHNKVEAIQKAKNDGIIH